MTAARYALLYISVLLALLYCTQVMLYPRPGRPGSASRRPVSAVAPIPFFSFHHVNAYEEDEAAGGAVVIDTIALRQFDFDKTLHTITLDHFNGGQRTEYYRLQVGWHGAYGAVPCGPWDDLDGGPHTEYCRLQVGRYSMGGYSPGICDRRVLLVWIRGCGHPRSGME